MQPVFCACDVGTFFFASSVLAALKAKVSGVVFSLQQRRTSLAVQNPPSLADFEPP
jgi:hypothetical protein